MFNASCCRHLGSLWFALIVGCLCTGLAPVALADRLFRLQPAANTAWALQSTTDRDIQINVLGAKAKGTERETIHAKLVVERVDPDGRAELVLVVERVEVSLKGEGGSVFGTGEEKFALTFDSSAPNHQEPSPIAESMLGVDLADRSSALIGVRRRLILKPNGDMEVKDPQEEKDVAAKTSPSLMVAAMFDPRSFVSLPDRPVPIGAAWHHDLRRSEVVRPRESGQAPAAGIFGLGRGKEVRQMESRYIGPEATVRGRVEKIATQFFFDDRSGLFGGLVDRGKCVGELAFDSMNGELVEAKWDIVVKDQERPLLGTIATTCDIHSVVTLARDVAPVATQSSGVIPLPHVR
jgi:hypothetical protein